MTKEEEVQRERLEMFRSWKKGWEIRLRARITYKDLEALLGLSADTWGRKHRGERRIGTRLKKELANISKIIKAGKDLPDDCPAALGRAIVAYQIKKL